MRVSEANTQKKPKTHAIQHSNDTKTNKALEMASWLATRGSCTAEEATNVSLDVHKSIFLWNQTGLATTLELVQLISLHCFVVHILVPIPWCNHQNPSW